MVFTRFIAHLSDKQLKLVSFKNLFAFMRIQRFHRLQKSFRQMWNFWNFSRVQGELFRGQKLYNQIVFCSDFELRISKSQNHAAGQWVQVSNSFKFQVYAIFDSLFGVLDSSRGQGPEGSALYLISNPNLLNTTWPKPAKKNRKLRNVFFWWNSYYLSTQKMKNFQIKVTD